MKVELDFDKKTITLNSNSMLGAFVFQIQNMFPDWEAWTLVVDSSKPMPKASVADAVEAELASKAQIDIHSAFAEQVANDMIKQHKVLPTHTNFNEFGGNNMTPHNWLDNL